MLISRQISTTAKCTGRRANARELDAVDPEAFVARKPRMQELDMSLMSLWAGQR
jgi:hypothetical protein